MASVSLFINGFLLYKHFRSKRQDQKPRSDKLNMTRDCSGRKVYGPPASPTGQRNPSFSDLKITDNVIYETIKDTEAELQNVKGDYVTIPEPVMPISDGHQSLLKNSGKETTHA